MSNKQETMVAILPSAFAEALCQRCTACKAGEERHPRDCEGVKNLLRIIIHKSHKYKRQDEKWERKNGRCI